MFGSRFDKALHDSNLPKIPDFKQGLEWFNSTPLSFAKELKGKVVVLDFWTYCCINCIHVLPDLAELEEFFKEEPVVFIGVHSPKFDNEKLGKNVLDAVRRYEITHPVVNDSSMTLWQALGVHSWPTFVVVGPEGHILFTISGEGHKETLKTVIEAILKHGSHFNRDSIPAIAGNVCRASPFNYPGKLTFGEGNLFISDSNNNRIVGKDLVIGSGKKGSEDGSFETASFNRPQGIAYLNGILYIADTENHLLRAANLKTRQVTTLDSTGFSTPWDVVVGEDRLFIAMAGTHQIWEYDVESGRAKAISGTGEEQNRNSKDLKDAAWAQPSGLALADGILYVADSESSAIRAIDLIEGETMTLVGGDSSNPYNLFSYGNRDGRGDSAKLQHPLGIAWHEGKQKLYIADSYNHSIRVLDPASGMLSTLEIDCALNEPAGLAISPDGSSLFVADTNNHLVRIINLNTLAVSSYDP